MENQLRIIDPKEYGLEEKKAGEIEKSFLPKRIESETFIFQFNNILSSDLTNDLIKPARELRLRLVKLRTGIAEIHKVEKAFFLASGKYVDALKNKLTLPVEQMEEKLLDIEKHFERIEAEKKAALKAERIKAFEPYSTDVSFMPLDEMTSIQFEGQLKLAKVAFESEQEKQRLAELERLKAEKKAEAELIEAARLEAERLEAQRLENIRLKEEADKREKELAIERKKQAEEQAKKDAAAKEEQDRLSKIAAEEKAKADKLSGEIKAKQDAEKAAFEAEEKRKHDLANAGDKEKFKEFYNTFKNVAFPELQNKEISDSINAKLKEFCKFMIEQSQKLV